MDKFIKSLFLWTGAGVLGGWLCGSIIFSLTALMGMSGSTGTEYIGYWSPGFIFLGALYGAPVGIICMISMRLIFCRLDDSFICRNWWKLGVVTTTGGVIGWIIGGIFIAPIVGVVCFSLAFALLAIVSARVKVPVP